MVKSLINIDIENLKQSRPLPAAQLVSIAPIHQRYGFDTVRARAIVNQ